MNEAIYQMYKDHKKLIEHPKFQIESDRTYIEEIKVGVTVIEENHPEYKDRYDREKHIQASFTAEQVDFICWQIGDWYIEWKHRIIVDLEEGTHRLGYAKEQLKTMICGE